MPAGSEVRPARWSQVTTLFDDGDSSVISGLYDGDDHFVLGIRWNGSGDGLGFPNVSGHAIWHVVPDLLAIPILNGLLAHFAGNLLPEGSEFVRNTLRALELQVRRQIESLR